MFLNCSIAEIEAKTTGFSWTPLLVFRGVGSSVGLYTFGGSPTPDEKKLLPVCDGKEDDPVKDVVLLNKDEEVGAPIAGTGVELKPNCC